MKSIPSHRVRSGFTLLELLVVISIIAALMSLILPAVQSARQAARRTQCLNNIRNLGIAMAGYEAAQKRYPAAGYWAGVPGSRYPSHNWVVDLLPYVDRKDLADRWDFTVAYTDAPNGALSRIQLPVLACPEDSSLQGNGDLSYGVAGGIGYTTFLSGIHDVPVDAFGHAIDLNGNGIVGVSDDALDGHPSDRTVLKSLGLFFMENFGEHRGVVRHYRADSIVDGYSHTLMLIENVRTGRDAAPDQNWATPFAHKSSVFFNSEVCSANLCDAGNVDYTRANGGDLGINSGLTKPEGQSPFANSEHPGGFNACFADGSAKFVSESIDGPVYAALFSPDSRRLQGSALDQPLVSDHEF